MGVRRQREKNADEHLRVFGDGEKNKFVGFGEKFHIGRDGLKKGVTLLELTLCLFLLGLIVLSAGNLLVYSANNGNRQRETAEALENARVSLDFLINQSRLAHEIRIVNYAGSEVLNILELHIINNEGVHLYGMRYDRREGRLDFGGRKTVLSAGGYYEPSAWGFNELAYGLKNVESHYDEAKRMLYFKVSVEINGEDEVFTGGVDTRDKKITT